MHRPHGPHSPELSRRIGHRGRKPFQVACLCHQDESEAAPQHIHSPCARFGLCAARTVDMKD